MSQNSASELDKVSVQEHAQSGWLYRLHRVDLASLSCGHEVSFERLHGLVLQIRQVIFESHEFDFVSLVIGFALEEVVALI